MQYKNQQWEPVWNPVIDDTTGFFYSNVFTIDQYNTFLCGYDGKVAKFNGDSVSVLFIIDESQVVSIALNSIFMTDSTHGWAVGDNGTVVKIDSNTYTLENQLPMYNFREVYFDSPEHGWIIGYELEHMSDGGVVFEYRDGQWNLHSTVYGQTYDIEFSSAGQGFISTAEDIYKYNGEISEWEPMHVQDYYPQYHLSMLNDSVGISVSDNSRNFIYENGVWSAGPAANVSDLASVYTTGLGSAWAVSQIGNNNPLDLNEGKIQLLTENTWSEYSIKYLDTIQLLPMDVAVTNITGTDKKNIWFDGGYINIPEDQDWPDPAPALNNDTFCTALKMFSGNFGIGLNGDLLEWNGQYWLNKNIDPVANPDTSIANICMHVFDDTTGFICRQLFAWSSGEISNVISYYDYQTNSLATAAVIGSRYPFAIHLADKRNGWCVGDSGLMVQYVNDNWNVLPAFTDKRLNDVFTVDSITAWAAGDEGLLYKYNGTIWEQQILPTKQNLHSVYFANNNNGWIVGDSGLIFHYNGTEWMTDSTGTTSTLYSIFMVDSAYGFAGGDNGLTLQYVKPVPPAPPVRKFCEYGDTWFVYHPAGPEGIQYVYQWQVDTGNGFENVIADPVFSGVNSDTLRLTSIPPDFYGYRFRCIATVESTDSISDVEELKFFNRWTGEISEAWEEPGNWSCGTVPGENTDVIIESGNIILSLTANIRSLAVSPGVNITIAEGGGLNILK